MKIFKDDQEVFDACYQHLSKQGFAAKETRNRVDIVNACVYLDEETGTSCAIGGILPPEIDRKALDRMEFGSSITSIMKPDFQSEACELVKETFQNVSLGLLEALQQAHDGTLSERGLDKWKLLMSEIAIRHDLSAPFAPTI